MTACMYSMTRKATQNFTAMQMTRSLINENGKIKKSGKVEDVDDVDTRVNDYIVTEVDDKKVENIRTEVK